MAQKSSSLNKISILLITCLLVSSIGFAQTTVKRTTAKPATIKPTPTNKQRTTQPAEKKESLSTNQQSSSHNGHEYVDLGLPSGTLWATCNIGANKPEERGDLFAWGEIKTRNEEGSYNYWEKYALGKGNSNDFIKYNDSDAIQNLLPEDDGAHTNWGGLWKMPSTKEFEELLSNCTWTYIRVSEGNEGYKGTAKNGNSIYLHVTEGNIDGFYFGHYWTTSLAKDTKKSASNFYFDRDEYQMQNHFRKYGAAIRPIYQPNETAETTTNFNEPEYVDLGLSTKWATCNVGASKPEEYGLYFAWGEKISKDKFDDSNYQHSVINKSGVSCYTKYEPQGSTGCSNFSDKLYTVLPEDDAATYYISDSWRLPTQKEIEELLKKCDWEWTDDYNNTGVKGFIVKGRKEYNKNSIFMPVAGINNSTYSKGVEGYYWSSSINGKKSYEAYALTIKKPSAYTSNSVICKMRYYGLSIRPVYSPTQTTTSATNTNNNQSQTTNPTNPDQIPSTSTNANSSVISTNANENSSSDYKKYSLSSKWTQEEIDKANTAKDITEITQEERNIFLWVNLARLYPKKFADYEVEPCLKSSTYNTSNAQRFISSLLYDLRGIKPLNALYYSRFLTEYAEEWAVICGKDGKTGHNRPQSNRQEFNDLIHGECCDYDNTITSKNTVLALLIDAYSRHNDIGHRMILLNANFDRMGVSIQPHKLYGQCCVLDLSNKSEVKY